jgi:hypothetical protein
MDQSQKIKKVIPFVGVLTILMILIVQLPFELAIVFRFGYMNGIFSLFLTYGLVILLAILIFKTKHKTILSIVILLGITKMMAFDYQIFIYLDQMDFISIIQIYHITQISWINQIIVILRYLYQIGLLLTIALSIYLKIKEK